MDTIPVRHSIYIFLNFIDSRTGNSSYICRKEIETIANGFGRITMQDHKATGGHVGQFKSTGRTTY